MWLLLACVAEPIVLGTKPGGGVSDTAEAVPPDTAVDTGADTGADTGETGDTGHVEDDHACADVYDPDTVLDVAVTITPEDWAGLERDYASGVKNYHPVHVAILGDEADAYIRLKGNPGFSWFIDKMQFVISFNHVDPDARFHGLRKLSLDAPWYDPTLMRDRLSWAVMGALPDTLFGVCINHARLTVNGEYYGLYANIEFLDHEWLERTMGRESATGTLWKYGTDPVANPEAARPARIRALESASTIDELRAVGEVDQWLDMWAAEAVLGDTDGYLCCSHNFYLYDHPTRGLLFVPWDFDLSFDSAPYTSDPIEGYGRAGLFDTHVIAVALADPATHAAYVERVAALNAAMADPAVLDRYDAWETQIDADALADPTRSWGDIERAQTVARMRAWIGQRGALVNDWVACQRGDTVDADADGYTVCADPDDTEATRYPGAPEVCNGLDDDGDALVDEVADCEDCVRHDADDAHLLFCSAPRTHAEAEAHCAAEGGALASVGTTAAYYLTYIYTWPNAEAWWLAGTSGSTCTTWNEGSVTTDREACETLLRSVCALP